MRLLSLPLSIMLHVGLAVVLLAGWGAHQRDPVYVPPIPIEVLTEAEFGELISVPETRTEDPVEEEPAPREEPAALPDPEPVQEETPPPAEILPPEEDPEPTPDPEPVEEEEPEIEEQPDPPQQQPEEEESQAQPPREEPEDDLDLGSLEDSLRDLTPDQDDRTRPSEISDDAPIGERNQERIGEGRSLTLTEEAAIQRAMQRCWSWDLGAQDAEALVVRLRITLSRDGELAGPVEVLNDGEINRSGNRYWQAARLRAVTAAESCAPYDFLDPGRYQNWQVMEFNFKPTF